MTEEDRKLLGYASLHCRTERALFHTKDLIRLYALAGVEEPSNLRTRDWWSAYAEVVEPLIKAAEERDKPKLRTWFECLDTLEIE